jgi:hypothetical protein
MIKLHNSVDKKCIFSIDNSGIFIDSLHSKPGEGKSMIRDLILERNKRFPKGGIDLQATTSGDNINPIMFYLLMGFEPCRTIVFGQYHNRYRQAELSDEGLKLFIKDIVDDIKLYLDANSTGRINLRMSQISMRMSATGFARWENAIENKVEFESFRKLEHLPLNDDQKKILADYEERSKSRIETKGTSDSASVSFI